MFVFQEIRKIQGRQLPDFQRAHRAAGHGAISVFIRGTWREVLDVWADGDDPSAFFGEDSKYAREINDAIDWASPCYVVVRYVDEGASNRNEIEDALYRFTTCDLVSVQTPVLAEIPRAPKEPPAWRRAFARRRGQKAQVQA